VLLQQGYCRAAAAAGAALLRERTHIDLLFSCAWLPALQELAGLARKTSRRCWHPTNKNQKGGFATVLLRKVLISASSWLAWCSERVSARCWRGVPSFPPAASVVLISAQLLALLLAGSCSSHSRTSHSRGVGGFHRPSRAPEKAMQCAARSSEGGLSGGPSGAPVSSSSAACRTPPRPPRPPGLASTLVLARPVYYFPRLFFLPAVQSAGTQFFLGPAGSPLKPRFFFPAAEEKKSPPSAVETRWQPGAWLLKPSSGAY
jgi:hypothetical protein